MVSRRDALKRMGAMAAGSAIGVSGDAESSSEVGPIGVQLYTVRSEMANGVEATLERVAAIDYEEVEFAGYFGHSPTEIRDMLVRTGLRSPATHIAPDFEPDAWARILNDANEVGHRYVVPASSTGQASSSTPATRVWSTSSSSTTRRTDHFARSRRATRT